MLFELCVVVSGALVPKLVGEKKIRTDDVQSLSASVFSVLYPALADYIVSVLKDVTLSMKSSPSQSTAEQHVSEASLPSMVKVSQVKDASHMIDVSETENVLPIATSPLLFPVLSLLCRLSPGLEVTDEGKT